MAASQTGSSSVVTASVNTSIHVSTADGFIIRNACNSWKFDLTAANLPDFSTVCARKQAIEMKVWRVLLRLSVSIHELGEVPAIGATGFCRRAVSRHYGKRIRYHFQAVKTTVLVDCETNVIIDVHRSMEQPNDSQIGRQVLTRNLDQLGTITADKAYDWDDPREELRTHDIRTVIKHKEHWQLDKAHNARWMTTCITVDRSSNRRSSR